MRVCILTCCVSDGSSVVVSLMGVLTDKKEADRIASMYSGEKMVWTDRGERMVHEVWSVEEFELNQLRGQVPDNV